MCPFPDHDQGSLGFASGSNLICKVVVQRMKGNPHRMSALQKIQEQEVLEWKFATWYGRATPSCCPRLPGECAGLRAIFSKSPCEARLSFEIVSEYTRAGSRISILEMVVLIPHPHHMCTMMRQLLASWSATSFEQSCAWFEYTITQNTVPPQIKPRPTASWYWETSHQDAAVRTCFAPIIYTPEGTPMQSSHTRTLHSALHAPHAPLSLVHLYVHQTTHPYMCLSTFRLLHNSMKLSMYALVCMSLSLYIYVYTHCRTDGPLTRRHSRPPWMDRSAPRRSERGQETE